jgi:hypothetical protein
VIIGGSECHRDRGKLLLEEGTDRGGRFVVDVEVNDGGVVRFEEGNDGCEGRNVGR